MMNTTATPPVDSPWHRAGHIAVLCGFTFSQPLFTALTQQFVYLHDLEAGWLEIGYLVILLALIVPALWIAIDWLVSARPWLPARLRNAVLAVLFCLFWMTLLRPFLKIRILELSYSIWLATFALAIPLGLASTAVYQTIPFVRKWISVAAVGLICFPGYFLYQYGSLHARSHPAPTRVDRPIPVVMIVFDEFSGLTLQDGTGDIDARKFPNFARLAATSSWYRQASTVHNRTDIAVPSLLTGQYPVPGRPALESEHPGNLFRRIHATDAYDMTVFEPITRLCPLELIDRGNTPRTSLQKLQSLSSTLMAVYPRLVLPKDFPMDLPPLSKLWFGLAEESDSFSSIRKGLIRPDPFLKRRTQLDQFLDTLRPGERPLFRFLHVELPHMPWCLLPSGREFDIHHDHYFEPLGATGDLGEDWKADPAPLARNEQRYLLQLQVIDQFVGRLLDRLAAIKLLDECLLIVTGDHGVAFRPGHSRRVPDAENLPDVLSIPLFIKFPGQTAGRVSDENVESIDVLPTLIELLGLTAGEPTEGMSLNQPRRSPRKQLSFDTGMLVLEPRIPQAAEAVARRRQLFPDRIENLPPVAMSRPEWQGRALVDFPHDNAPLAGHSATFAPSIDGDSARRPCFVWGTCSSRDGLGDLSEVLLVVDGVIRDSQRTVSRGRRQHCFEFLIPDAVDGEAPGTVALYLIESAGSTPRLRRIGHWPEAASDSPRH